VPLIVGTSGWQYRHWRGTFYPAGVPQHSWLEYYAERFASVENDGTFYRLPDRQTFTAWRQRTPEGFVMAIKASRFLTHVKRLKDPAEPVARLLAAAGGLSSRLGPVLLQLPPTLQADPVRLAACLAEFGKNAPAGGTVRVAVEPRHESWWNAGTQELLAAHGAALCLADRAGRSQTPLWRPAGWGYLRLHEGDGHPWPRYRPATLRSWLDRIKRAWPDTEADVYVYFNNDAGGAAVLDGAAFAELAGQAGLTGSG
jgi:uncharacterized protein YecE (DUF72 family)